MPGLGVSGDGATAEGGRGLVVIRPGGYVGAVTDGPAGAAAHLAPLGRRRHPVSG
ncbi:hypothetical protein ABGB17_25200 [Sphaerisporangium sp. B11E5]|uniref:hypothetical protein n=1 Tax=Sphaerisporangium sp. B11E5 TaxID=3153563 RepID=UPI00325DBEC4